MVEENKNPEEILEKNKKSFQSNNPQIQDGNNLREETEPISDAGKKREDDRRYQ